MFFQEVGKVDLESCELIKNKKHVQNTTLEEIDCIKNLTDKMQNLSGKNSDEVQKSFFLY